MATMYRCNIPSQFTGDFYFTEEGMRIVNQCRQETYNCILKLQQEQGVSCLITETIGIDKSRQVVVIEVRDGVRSVSNELFDECDDRFNIIFRSQGYGVGKPTRARSCLRPKDSIR